MLSHRFPRNSILIGNVLNDRLLITRLQQCLIHPCAFIIQIRNSSVLLLIENVVSLDDQRLVSLDVRRGVRMNDQLLLVNAVYHIMKSSHLLTLEVLGKFDVALGIACQRFPRVKAERAINSLQLIGLVILSNIILHYERVPVRLLLLLLQLGPFLQNIIIR